LTLTALQIIIQSNGMGSKYVIIAYTACKLVEF